MAAAAPGASATRSKAEVVQGGDGRQEEAQQWLQKEEQLQEQVPQPPVTSIVFITDACHFNFTHRHFP